MLNGIKRLALDFHMDDGVFNKLTKPQCLLPKLFRKIELDKSAGILIQSRRASSSLWRQAGDGGIHRHFFHNTTKETSGLPLLYQQKF
ncbi:unnamed protein product [Ambrosiozyma monospora]|uniref:Unnamed protein product n=1 Tax=Ambrosiozyma monospora TaxID=43982 RepID=A0ACB5TA39_AMBMO|nr:unnamed protein product [Ambrosiozyma monospora]